MKKIILGLFGFLFCCNIAFAQNAKQMVNLIPYGENGKMILEKAKHDVIVTQKDVTVKIYGFLDKDGKKPFTLVYKTRPGVKVTSEMPFPDPKLFVIEPGNYIFTCPNICPPNNPNSGRYPFYYLPCEDCYLCLICI